MRQGSAQPLERMDVAPTRSTELTLRRRLIVSLSLGLLPLTLLWSVIYFAAGAPLSAAVPGLYMIIAPINAAVFRFGQETIYHLTSSRSGVDPPFQGGSTRPP